MVNFEYWEWRKKRGLPVIARPASRDAVEKKNPAVAKSAGSLDSLIGAVEAITEMRESMIINNKEIAGLLALRQEKETQVIIEKQPSAPVMIKDRHRQLIRLLMSEASSVDYAQISRKLGVAKSSVRVYVSDLQNLGFPFLKKKAGGKVLIRLNSESRDFVRELLEKYGID